MLSRRRPELTDPTLLAIAYQQTTFELSKAHKISLASLQLLLLTHGVQGIFNRYITLVDLLSLVPYTYGNLYQQVKVLLNKGYLERINRSRLNVTLAGLDVVRAYDTRIARKYIEFTTKQRKEWKYIPMKKGARLKQIKNKQYPPRVIKK